MFEEHLRSILKNFPGWEIKESINELWTPEINGQRNKCKWFTTQKAGGVQGQHAVVEAKSFDDDEIAAFAREGGLIILIRDESGEISKEKKESGDTYNAKWVFNFGNATIALGWWYDCFTKFRALYRVHEVTAYESSYWTREQIERKKTEWGENSDKFKRAMLAQFTDAGEHTIIPLSQINICVGLRIPKAHDGRFVGGLDLAAARRGGDECVLTYRLGNEFFLPIVFKGFTDEMAVVGEVIRTMRGKNPHNVKIRYVFADAGGLGGPMISRIMEVLGQDGEFYIHRVHFQAKPNSGRALYHDKGMEMYQNVADLIASKRIIVPKDDVLIAQLATRKFKPQSSGAPKLLDKEEQRKISGGSPDRADSFVLAALEPNWDLLGRGKQNTIEAGGRPWPGHEVETHNLHDRHTGDKSGYGYSSGGKFLGR